MQLDVAPDEDEEGLLVELLLLLPLLVAITRATNLPLIDRLRFEPPTRPLVSQIFKNLSKESTENV